MMPLLILLAGIGLVPVMASSPHQNGGQAAGPNGLQCQRIAVSACQGLGYNMTALPNLAGHTNQLEAELQVRKQWSLMAQRAGTSRSGDSGSPISSTFLWPIKPTLGGYVPRAERLKLRSPH